MNGVNIWVRGIFQVFWASDLGTIIFMLPQSSTGVEGIVILFNSLSYVGYTDDSPPLQR